MYNNKELLAGWKLTFNEVSNNVYKVTLTDAVGRIAETTDSILEKAIATVENYAFDIQKKLSGSWNKFLFDTCTIKLADKVIIEKQYHDEAFGSWYITLTKNRALLDGKDSVLYLQIYKEDWVDIKIINLSDLTYTSFITVINQAE